MSARTRKILAMCAAAPNDSDAESEIDIFANGDDSDQDKNYEPSSEDDFSDDSLIPGSVVANYTSSSVTGVQSGQLFSQDSGEDSEHDGETQATNQETSEACVPMKRKKGVSKKRIRYDKRLRGESYTGFRGVVYPGRPLLPAPCVNKAKHDCSRMVSDENRQRIYSGFRSLTTDHDQQQFIVRHILMTPKKRGAIDSRRSNTMVYRLTVNGELVKVCRTFFISTLNVTDAKIRSAMSKLTDTGIIRRDLRGSHTPHNKLPQVEEHEIRNFILSFPTMESHYCRKSTTKKYLDANLNITILYNKFNSHCEEKQLRKVSCETFRKIFREYNLGFFRPKKDQCKKCLAFDSLSSDDKLSMNEEHQRHLRRKVAARAARDEDKTMALNNEGSCLSFNFDLEAVLNIPKGSAGQIFYLRKLAVYNFTIFELNSHDGHCYLWDETHGKLGANEIASILLKFIKMKLEVLPDLSTVRVMSDSCGGQNKNSMVAALCIYLLVNTSLQTVRHSFFEPGHSEMECDSMHSKIERKSQNVPVFIPEGWVQLIRAARRQPSPFSVTTMLYDDFHDFSSMAKTTSVTIPWKTVCCLEFRKSGNGQVDVFYKREFEEEFTQAALKRKKGRRSNDAFELRRAYSERLPISEAKWKDLKKMCDDLTIHKEYHGFFNSIQPSSTERDYLPEPDVSEESDYEE